jgi:hypothetical protein
VERFATKPVKIILGLALLGVVAWGVYHFAIRPWIDRWGAADPEITAILPGDEFVPYPAGVVNRAVTIQAAPEAIYPWLVQMGAGKGGLYSYSSLETNLLRCPLINADRIHPEWQDLKPGDLMKMCPSQPGPVPYTVVSMEPNRAIVLGHQNPDGTWSDTWQFVIQPQADGSSRLIVRTRTNLTGGIWDILHPGIFIMERGMLLGIKERAET